MYQVEFTESYCPAQADEVVQEVTVGDALREAAHDRPDTLALIEINAVGKRDSVLSYQELLNRCEVLARALTTRFSKGERVVVWAHNVAEWLVMEYACALAGVVLVTANPSFRAKELRYVLEQSGAVGLFLVKDYRNSFARKDGLAVTKTTPANAQAYSITNHSATLCAHTTTRSPFENRVVSARARTSQRLSNS
jgi:fatty-acyl-CoA synthase